MEDDVTGWIDMSWNEKRIMKDIELLEKNLKEISSLNFTKEEMMIIQRAENYKEDSIYYLEKGDHITSFGCINYAHGLIDSLRILYEIM